jgi:hypothetical protein
MQNAKRKQVSVQITVVAFLLLMRGLLSAQEPKPQQPDNSQQQSTQPDKNTEEQPPTPLVGPAAIGPTPIDTQVHPAGQAVPWFGSSSPLRWGDFSIANFTYDFVNDRFQPFGNEPNENVDLSILRTSLVFDHHFGKQELLLQYNPQLAVLNGKVAGNAGMDNEISLGTTFQVTPRFTFVLKDGFVQMHARELYPPNYLGVDPQGGNLFQLNFLQNAGSYLMNAITGVGVYQWTPRDTLSFASTVKYVHANVDNNFDYNVPVETGLDFGESLAFTHRLTVRQSVGVVYTFELLRATEQVAVPGNTYFHTIAGFYAMQVSGTWALRGEFGGTFATYPDNVPSRETMAGGVSIMKDFKNDVGYFALAYTRGRTENNFITANIGDLVQAVYSQHLSKRLVWNSGAGYYRETGAEPRANGKMLASALDLEFIPNFFLSGSYAYLFQRATTAELLSGQRYTAVLGLRWEPHPLQGH